MFSDTEFQVWITWMQDWGSIQSRPTQHQDPTRGCLSVIESLEEALTVVDTSDEEPLVRAQTGRHVVRWANGVQLRAQTDSRQQQTHHQMFRFFLVGPIPVLWRRLDLGQSFHPC